jgi:hypothetical protein
MLTLAMASELAPRAWGCSVSKLNPHLVTTHRKLILVAIRRFFPCEWAHHSGVADKDINVMHALELLHKALDIGEACQVNCQTSHLRDGHEIGHSPIVNAC